LDLYGGAGRRGWWQWFGPTTKETELGRVEIPNHEDSQKIKEVWVQGVLLTNNTELSGDLSLKLVANGTDYYYKSIIEFRISNAN
jgi:hypothetical protein